MATRASAGSTERAVRASVRQVLASSPAYAALPASQQRVLARQMTRVANFIVAGPQGDTIPTTATVAAELISEVDFPAFVSALIQGVFQAVVNASVQQMNAYGDLLKDATKAIDAYVQDDDGDDDDTAALATRRQAHANRQQLLATMVLMGINRIVVTDGVVNASVTFKLAPTSD
jgi:hypothetical protein